MGDAPRMRIPCFSSYLDLSQPTMASPKTSWISVREELAPRRRLAVTCLSFLFPLLLWAIFGYAPGPWQRDVRLDITANWEESRTVYTPGDRLNRKFFPGYQEAIRVQNAFLAENGASVGTDRISQRQLRRANKNVIRQLGRLAEAKGWVEPLPQDAEGQAFKQYDEALFGVWKKLAAGDLAFRQSGLSEENLKIIRYNWNLLRTEAPTSEALKDLSKPLLQLIPQGQRTAPDYLPPPHEVVLTAFKQFTTPPAHDRPWMHERLGSSLFTVFAGFLAAAALAVPLGILCGTYDLFSRFFEPFTDFFRYMPAPVFSTLLVAILGVYSAPKIALIWVGTYFQMLLVVANTTRQLDQSLLEAARTLGAGRHSLVTTVIIPGILPNLYNDMRILLGWAWTWLVIAELIGVKSGLTEIINTQGMHRNFDQVYAVILLIGFIGFTTDQILQLLRPVLFPYLGLKRSWLTRALSKSFSFIR